MGGSLGGSIGVLSLRQTRLVQLAHVEESLLKHLLPHLRIGLMSHQYSSDLRTYPPDEVVRAQAPTGAIFGPC